MTQPQTNPATVSPAAKNGEAGDDPLLHLFKMSATAGVGVQDYVAINITAVVALLFGIASAFAFMSNALLVIPLAALVLGFIALQQIRNSNGTQTGKLMALGGIVLALLLGGGSVTMQVIDRLQHRADAQAIAQLCSQYGQLMHDHKYAEAYDLFDGDFRQRVGPKPFESHLRDVEEATSGPVLSALEWNGIGPDIQDTDSGATARAVMIVHYANSNLQGRLQASFRTVGNEWKFDDIPSMFPKLKGQMEAQGADQTPAQ